MRDVRILPDHVDGTDARLEAGNLDLNAERRDEGLGHLGHGGSGDSGQLHGGLFPEDLCAAGEEADRRSLFCRDRLVAVSGHPQGREQAGGGLPFDGQRRNDLADGERSTGPEVQVERQLSEVGGGSDLLHGGAERQHIADELEALGPVGGVRIVETPSFELLARERRFVAHGSRSLPAGRSGTSGTGTSA